MAQQGGTYRAPSKNNVAAKPESSSRFCGHDESKGDGEQWEVIQKPEAEKKTVEPNSSVSSHFDIEVGWGRWKRKIFEWDLNVRKSSPKSGGERPQNLHGLD